MRRLFGRRRAAREWPDEPPEHPRAARRGELPADGAASVGGVRLPPGRRVRADSGEEVLWRTALPDHFVGAWGRLALAFPETGLWPVVLCGRSLDVLEVRRGWEAAAAQDPETLMREQWLRESSHDEELRAMLGDWPGLGRGGEREPAALDVAAMIDDAEALALVPAARPADVLPAIGWDGAVNYGDVNGRLAAIMRSWEERYDAILVGLSLDTAHLAVRRPPPADQARRAAAEQYVFCPDVVTQGAGSVDALAESLAGLAMWSFWWD
jgi:hypothetical protein